MKTWLKENWRWLVLNLFALAVMTDLLRQAGTTVASRGNYDPLLVESGKWAVRFLLFSLAMTPLNTLFGWRSAVKLRQPAGLWAFAFAMAHFMLNIAATGISWLQYPIPDWIAALGLIALAVLTLMAPTSLRWMMKRMGKWWKRLHRLIYATSVIILLHALLEFPSKRVLPYDENIGVEINLYIGILAMLLVARIPPIRAALANLKQQRGARGRIVVE